MSLEVLNHAQFDMKKQIKTLAAPAFTSYVLGGIFGIAGLVAIGYGSSQMLGDSSDGFTQFAIALLLGGGFLAISFFVIHSGVAAGRKIAWLNEHGVWITAKPVEARTVTSDDYGNVTSFCLILKAVDADASVKDMADQEFESDPIQSRWLSEDYQDKEYDIVIDPSAPADNYHVNVSLQAVLS